MANMSYCRFQNTLQGLRDCRENMDEKRPDDLWLDERWARWRLIQLCAQIAADYADEADSPMPK